MARWYFEPIMNSYFVVAILAATLGLLMFIGPQGREGESRRRRILLLLRGGVVLLVICALLRPTRVATSSQRQSAALVVLIDVSRSMTLPQANSDGDSRWRTLRQRLDEAQPLLEKLRRTIDVKIYVFDAELRPVPWEGGAIPMPAEPTGDETDLGTPLFDAVRQELGKRIAGVLLLSDGAQTSFAPRVELYQAGHELARLDHPLFAVPFGQPGDASQFADVAVVNLPEQLSVFVKNELAVPAMVRIQGFAGKSIPVQMTVEGPGGARTIGPFPVEVKRDGEAQRVSIPFTPEEPGQYKVTVQAEHQPSERITTNNELTAFITVRDGGVKTAYLVGGLFSGPPGEQIRLRQSLAASPDIQLDHKFIYDSDADRDRWPVDIRDVLEGDYDVVLIENVDSSALGGEALNQLAELVDQGTGLLMIGGFHSFAPGGYRETPLRDVLPIELGRFQRQELGIDKPINRDLHLFQPLRMTPTREHPVTSLASTPAENLAVWSGLPPLLGANRFEEIKPTGLVICASEQNHPLLVTGQYGQGRVLAFAGDSTRRWWKDHRAQHKRFWRQVVLWLAQRDETERKDVWITTDKRRFDIGQKLNFETGVADSEGKPITAAQMQAVLKQAGEVTGIPLSLEGDHWFGRLDRLRVAGSASLEVTARQGGQVLGSAKIDLQIADRDIELANPAADHEQLARFARLTKDAGGKLVPPDEMQQLLQEILDQPPEMKIDIQTKWQLASTWWDSWLFLLLFVGLLTTEWALRKRWRLV
jgi:uncharacterized membrane protein